MSEDILYSTVSAASEWPREVAHIAKFLTDAVPSGLLSSSPRLSGVTAPLWHDMVRTHCAATDSADISTPVSDEFIGMIERLLYSVAILQSLKASGSTVRELRPAVSLLFHALGDTCLPQLKISGERPFALSRYNGQGGTVGQVFKLLSVMSTHQGEEEETPAGDNEPVDPSANSSAYSMTDDSNSETTDSSLSESPRPLADLALQRHPADTHFLDSWHDQRSWLCPFICVADTSHICEAMVSAACQRFNWSISEPVVGLALMDDGTSIEIHFAWAKPSPRMSNMPFVHVVSTLGSDASMGAYDLSDPISTLLLAQFLLSLRSAADAFSNICHNSQYLNVNWRADSAIEDASVAPYTSGTMINKWIHQVEPSSGDFVEKDHKSPSPSTSVASFASSHSPSFIMTNDSSGHGKRSTSHSQLSGRSKTTPPVIFSNSGDSAVTRKSTSGLYGTVEENVSTEEASIGSFLHDRNVIEVACISLTAQRAESDDSLLQATEEINGMTEIYNMLMNYIPFPKDFLDQDDVSATESESNEDTLLSTKSELDELRAKLANQVKHFESDRHAVETLPGDHPLAAVLSASLPSLLSAVQMARNVKTEGANEAEARYGWDLLISVTSVAGKELTSPRLKLERTFPLSRNTLYDYIKSSGGINSMTSMLTTNANLNYDLAVDAAFNAPRAFRDQMSQATALATGRREDVKILVPRIVRRHAKEEACTATCDSFLGFPALRDSSTHIPEPFLRMDSKNLSPISEDTDEKEDQAPGRNDAQPNSKKVQKSSIVTKPSSEWVSEVNPYLVNTTETCPTTLIGTRISARALALLEQLVLPVFLVEHKKPKKDFSVALRQLKLYLTSAVAFLASLEIKGYPVFGLATNGTIGVVLCAWRSVTSQYTYIMDRHVRTFDLTSPIEMYQFATFMARLRTHSDTVLADLVKKHIGNPSDFTQYREGYKQKTWTKDAQVTQYPEIEAMSRGAKK